MTFPSIRIEGSILSGELLAKLDSADTRGQRPADFGFDSQSKLKDEIVRAWAAGQAFYKAFQHKLEGVKEGNAATSETRNQWMIPLLGLLGYAELEFQSQSELVGDKPFRISHRLRSHGGFAVHIVGARESLDRKPEAGAGPRVSPHAHVQEYLNLTEHLYAVVTNGRLLRLLRDSTRLVRLSYVEFDLDRMFGEDLFADFAVFYRLLHVTRLPKAASHSPESLIEHYHQDSLVSGERIRDGLSGAVKDCILKFADGFLNHPQSEALRERAASDPEFAAHLYQHLLRLVYRLLFLMVIEERNLVYADGTDKRKRNLYYAHYSLARLRRIAEKRHLADGRHHDCWAALRSTFRLFDESAAGRPLGIEPLGGDLFDSGALGMLGQSSLDNETLLACLRNLSLFRNPDTGQLMRVNYAALNVEEFGSVYQGLLEFEPQVQKNGNSWAFNFAKGDERSRTGSHYTPDELVQPLIKHSLDYLIADKLAEARAASEKSSKAPSRSPSPPAAGGEGRGEVAFPRPWERERVAAGRVRVVGITPVSLKKVCSLCASRTLLAAAATSCWLPRGASARNSPFSAPVTTNPALLHFAKRCAMSSAIASTAWTSIRSPSSSAKSRSGWKPMLPAGR